MIGGSTRSTRLATSTAMLAVVATVTAWGSTPALASSGGGPASSPPATTAHGPGTSTAAAPTTTTPPVSSRSQGLQSEKASAVRPALALAPTVTQEPATTTVREGQTATFTAAAGGSPAPTVQWQLSTDRGANFQNLPGATSTSLSRPGAAINDSNVLRAVFTNVAGTAASNPAILHVTIPPPVTPRQPVNNASAGTATGPAAPHVFASAPTVTPQSVGPQATFSPASVDFGNVVVGQRATHTVTLSNTGDSAMIVKGVGVTGPFFIDGPNHCLSVGLEPQQSCQVSVTFAPTQPGSATGTVFAEDDAPGSPQTVPLSATGAQPAVSLFPTSVNFGDRVVGSKTTTAVQVTNSGTADLHISNIDVTGAGFSLSSIGTCNATVAPSSSCTFFPSYAPTQVGSVTGAATLTDDAADSPQSVPMSANATPAVPAVSLNPTSIDFGQHSLGSTTTTVVTVTNTGTGDLHVLGTSAAAPYAVRSDQCTGTVVAPQTICQIFVTFSPTQLGAASGDLTISDDAPGSPQLVPLSGTGTRPAVSLNPTSIDFGSHLVGSTVTTVIVVTNTGTGDLHVSATSVPPPFSVISETCTGAPVAPQGTCSVFVRFTPTQRGLAFGSLTITDDAPGSPQTVPLSGRGTAPVVSVSPNPVFFGNVAVGGFGRQDVFITNTGDADLHITDLTTLAPFSIDPNLGTCTFGAAIAPGDSCGLAVDLRPTSAGLQTGTLTITDDATDSPQQVPLFATAGPSAQSAVVVAPNPVAFADTPVGSRGREDITVTNVGSADLSISDMTASAPFSVNPVLGSCLPITPLPPGQSCAAELDFDPTTGGLQHGTLTLTDNAPDSPQKVVLSGTAVAPVVSPNPASITYGGVRVGDFKSVLLEVTNTGNADLHVAATHAAAPFSIDVDQCTGVAVSPGNFCDLFVRFMPTQTGTATGSVTIDDDAPGSPQQVPLSGSGTQPAISVTPNPVTFGDVLVGSSGPRSVTIRNTGTADLTLKSFGVTGPFAINTAGSACILNSPIPPGGACTTEVHFNPTVVGPATGSFSVNDDAPGSPQTVALSGIGVAPAPAVSINPPMANFGDVALGQVSPPAQVTVTNAGTGDLHVARVDVSGKGFALSFGANTCGGAVKPGDACTFQVQFEPSQAGPVTGSAAVTDDAPGSPQTVALSGTGVKPAPVITGLSPDHGPSQGGTRVTIQGLNLVPGQTTVTIDGTVVPASEVTVSGDPTAAFTTPAHPPGRVQVVVSTPSAQSNSLGFTYDATPTPPPPPPAPPIPPHPAPAPRPGSLATSTVVQGGGTAFVQISVGAGTPPGAVPTPSPGAVPSPSLGATEQQGGAGGALAFTGGSLRATVALGLALIVGGAGAIFVARERRRRQAMTGHRS